MEDLLKEKVGMDMKMLAKKPGMYYAKIGVMVLGAYLIGKLSSR